MADDKKKAGWIVEGSNLKWNGKTGATLTLDILRLFPDFEDYELNQQYTIVYGIKQFVADDSAAAKPTDVEKCKFYPERYDEVVRGEVKTKREKADLVGKQKFLDAVMSFGATMEEAEAKWTEISAKK
jgi:hypothetical protein